MKETLRRSKQDIIYDMLRAIQTKGGTIKPTHLLYKSNLSHQRMKQYIEELRERRLIEERQQEEKTVIILTQTGYEFLQKFQQLKAFTDTFGL